MPRRRKVQQYMTDVNAITYIDARGAPGEILLLWRSDEMLTVPALIATQDLLVKFKDREGGGLDGLRGALVQSDDMTLRGAERETLNALLPTRPRPRGEKPPTRGVLRAAIEYLLQAGPCDLRLDPFPATD